MPRASTVVVYFYSSSPHVESKIEKQCSSSPSNSSLHSHFATVAFHLWKATITLQKIKKLFPTSVFKFFFFFARFFSLSSFSFPLWVLCWFWKDLGLLAWWRCGSRRGGVGNGLGFGFGRLETGLVVWWLTAWVLGLLADLSVGVGLLADLSLSLSVYLYLSLSQCPLTELNPSEVNGGWLWIWLLIWLWIWLWVMGIKLGLIFSNLLCLWDMRVDLVVDLCLWQ